MGQWEWMDQYYSQLVLGWTAHLVPSSEDLGEIELQLPVVVALVMSITHSYVGFSFLSLSGPLTTAPWISIYFRSCFSLTFRRTQDSSVITLLSSFFVFLCLLRTLSHSLQNCGITFGYNVHYHSGMNSVSSFECVIKSIDLFPCILKITLEFRVCISIRFLRVGFFVYGEFLWRKQRYIIHCAWFRKFVE